MLGFEVTNNGIYRYTEYNTKEGVKIKNCEMILERETFIEAFIKWVKADLEGKAVNTEAKTEKREKTNLERVIETNLSDLRLVGGIVDFIVANFCVNAETYKVGGNCASCKFNINGDTDNVNCDGALKRWLMEVSK